MKKLISTFLFTLLLGLSLTACSIFHHGKISQDKLPWKASGDVLYQEDFSDPSTKWEEVNNAYEIKRYSDQGYFVYVQPEHGRTVSTSGHAFSNVKFSVEAQKVTGSEDTNYGLVCRYQDNQNFYGFSVGTDGYVAIYKVSQGQTKILSGDKYAVSQHVNQSDGVNAIIASCIDDNLSLNINGNDVLTVKDEQFSIGEVGLLMETSDEGMASAVFNNFIVVKP